MQKFTFFWRGPLSQWARSPFSVEGTEYFCAEQFMMSEKAKLFGDHEINEAIMNADNPSECKQLGRKVKNYNDEAWNAVAKDVVYKANHAKFTQNPELYEKLMASEGELVEASPYDKKWGIGLREDDVRAQDKSTWCGTNWLGEVLTQLRDDFRKGTQ
jgi:ribA/ribD-fused uncharacterized protein